MTSTAHYVELDLLRGNRRLPVEDLPPCSYCALVSRVEERPEVGLWPVTLRDPLPTISVPLRAPDADVSLDLLAVFARAFSAGGYDRYIYEGSPDPPLAEEDFAWAAELLNLHA